MFCILFMISTWSDTTFAEEDLPDKSVSIKGCESALKACIHPVTYVRKTWHHYISNHTAQPDSQMYDLINYGHVLAFSIITTGSQFTTVRPCHLAARMTQTRYLASIFDSMTGPNRRPDNEIDLKELLEVSLSRRPDNGD